MPYNPTVNRTYAGILLGETIRKSIAKTTIFRNRGGNGYYGSQRYKRYQSKYPYVVPVSINNPEGQPARDALKQAVLNWQIVLTEEEKATYNEYAKRHLCMSGYNLYIKEYIRANL